MSVKNVGIIASIFLGLSFYTSTTQANSSAVWVDGQNMVSPYMRVYGMSLPPIGHVYFCENHPHECQPKDTVKKTRVQLTPRRLHELDYINRTVNAAIKPVTDKDLYGQLEYWTYPQHQSGDCEDYVLLKRHKLMQLGWPESALLITVVLDEKGEGHAILTVRTAQGDYLLDNKHSEIVQWNQVPYRFIKRQSYSNPKVWVSLLPSDKRQSFQAASSDQ